MKPLYDVLVIGGGVIGSAIARELSRYDLRIGVLEKNLDVCYETSGRNSAVVHGGFAYDTGSLKAMFCVEGNRMMGELAKELDMPVQIEVMSGSSGTNAWPIQVSREGVATAVLSIPERYMHTPLEVVYKRDLEDTARLLAAFVESLGEGEETC